MCIRNYTSCSDIMIASQILRLKDLQSVLEHQKRYLEEMTPRKDAESKGNLVAFLCLEYMTSKVFAVGVRSYFLLKILDSLEFCEISRSWFLFYPVGQLFLVSFAGCLSLLSLNLQGFMLGPLLFPADLIPSWPQLPLKLDSQVGRQRDRKNIISVLDSRHNFRFVFQSPIPYLHLDVSRHPKLHMA